MTAPTAARAVHARPWAAPAAVLTGGLVIRAALVAATRHLPLSGDAKDYDRLARLLAGGHGWGHTVLAAGGGPTAFRAPLYPLFLAAVYRVTGDSLTAARLAEALLGAVTIGLITWIGGRLLGARPGLWAGAIAAVYPPFVVYSTALLSEALFVPIELGALAAALMARERGPNGPRWTILAGVLGGLGILDRPNSFVLLVPLAVLVAVPRGRGRHASSRAGLLLATAAVVLTPWVVRNAVVMHALVPVTDIDGFNLAGVYNADSGHAPYPYRYQFRPPVAVASLAPLFHDPHLGEVALGDRLRSRGLTYLADHPLAVPEAMAWNTFRILDLPGRGEARATMTEAGYGRRIADATLVGWFLLAALALVGLATGALRRIPPAVLAFPVLLWLVDVPFLGTARMRVPIEPFVVLVAAAGIDALARRRHQGAAAAPPPGEASVRGVQTSKVLS